MFKIKIDTCVVYFDVQEGTFMHTKRERTRKAIIDASYKLFVKGGFTSITMKDICEAVDMSRGGLYSHFSSTKEEAT